MQILKHIYIGSESAHTIAHFFKHVAGVVSVHKGEDALTKKTFVHISFDDIETTFEKLTAFYISIAEGSGDKEIILYKNNYDNSGIGELIKLNNESGKENIIEGKLSEFISHEQIGRKNTDIVVYLASPDETNMKTSTREGLINELNNTKRAMLNLLEDAYESQDKIMAQADNLSKALAESQKFAKTAEEERSNYLLLISSIGQGIIVLTPTGEVNIANNAALSLFRLKREEMYGKRVNDILEIRDRKNNKIPLEIFKKIISSGEQFNLPPLIVSRKDGTSVVISTIVSPVIKKQTNEHVGVILSIRDIGEELALDDARINFISTASHQLRTPLTAMRWFIEMLYNGEAGKINEEQHHYLDQIDQGVGRMVNLVNYLLRTARVESNRTKIIPTNLLIRDIIANCVEKLKQNIDAKKQTVKITGDDIPPIPLDADYANEVFINILKNANLYGKEGDEIIVEKKLFDDHATVSITDHGIGISDEDRSRVFGKFFRSEKAVIASPDGTGLGLSFINSLVKEWGGEITFVSNAENKTTFTVTIPLAGMKPREGEVRLTD